MPGHDKMLMFYAYRVWVPFSATVLDTVFRHRGDDMQVYIVREDVADSFWWRFEEGENMLFEMVTNNCKKLIVT